MYAWPTSWEDDLNSGFSSSNPIPLWLEFRILENQDAADRNPHAAQRGLTQVFLLRAVEDNFSPGLGIDLDGHIEGDHRACRLVGIDGLGDGSPQIAVAVFEGV